LRRGNHSSLLYGTYSLGRRSDMLDKKPPLADLNLFEFIVFVIVAVAVFAMFFWIILPFFLLYLLFKELEK
jgi:hypothetical protein